MRKSKSFDTRRCSWCDCVNNYMVQNVPGRYKKAPKGNDTYLHDPFGKRENLTLCITCYEVHQDLMDDYLKKDLEEEFEDE